MLPGHPVVEEAPQDPPTEGVPLGVPYHEPDHSADEPVIELGSVRQRRMTNPKCRTRFRMERDKWCKPCTQKKKCTAYVEPIGETDENMQMVTDDADIQPDNGDPDGNMQPDNGDPDENVQEEDDGNISVTLSENDSREVDEPITADTVSEGDVVSLDHGEEHVLISRMGKRNGSHRNWWRMKNKLTNNTMERNLDDVGDIVRRGKTALHDTVYATNVPRYRHSEKQCILAKEEELKKFDDFQVYVEVPDQGQRRLGTNWVIVEKNKDGLQSVKARLTIRGDQENTDGVRTDSPTIKKGNLKILLVVAAMKKWQLKSADISSAFLQSVPLEREVYALPPVERRVPGLLWQLKKPVYGLADASRGFHLSLNNEIKNLGCETNHLDPALYAYYDSKTGRDDYIKDPLGLAVSHVDDILHAGEKNFETKIIRPLKKTFKFGSEEQEAFRYIGLNMRNDVMGICLDQNHYLQSMEVPDLEDLETLNDSQILNEDGQNNFRSFVAKLAMVGYQSRPDVCFEAKVLSTKYGKATKHDMKVLMKKIVKLKASTSVMMFPDLGPVDKWGLIAHGDAGIKAMPDKATSVAGSVIMLVNRDTGRTCILSWKSKKIRRKVSSSLAGETLAMVMAFGELIYTRSVLRFILGGRVDKIPSVVFTDSNNLFKSVYSTSQVDDSWLIADMASLKDALEEGTVSEVRLVPGNLMIANCLTKAGASGDGLLQILRSGMYDVPGGWKED